MAGKGFSHEPIKVDEISTKYRTIKTALPVPESIPIIEQMYELESRAMHGQVPLIWDKAEGFQIYDKWGNKWLDFTSTIFVANAGHGNKKIINALKKILDKPLLHTYTYASEERVNYLNYLIDNTPSQFEKAFLLSAGTEATEAALKLMRLNGEKQKKNKGGIICFNGNWHGRTLGAQMMSGNKEQKEWIGYQDPNIYHIEFPYPWSTDNPREFFKTEINKLLTKEKIDPKKDLCGFMLETFQGWGAVFYPKVYVKMIESFCLKNNLCFSHIYFSFKFGTYFLDILIAIIINCSAGVYSAINRCQAWLININLLK